MSRGAVFALMVFSCGLPARIHRCVARAEANATAYKSPLSISDFVGDQVRIRFTATNHRHVCSIDE